MLKKIGNYYLGIIKKFGVVIPSVIVGVLILCGILVDAFDGLTALSDGGFVAVAIIGCAIFVAGIVYTVLKLKAKELGYHDLGLACFAVAGIVMLISFIFLGGMLWKWLTVAIGVIVCIAVGVLRVLNLD